MDTLDRCGLVTLRFDFDSDSGTSSQMALCGCFSVAGMRSALNSAFAHPLFSTLDDSARFEMLAHSVERYILAEAGIACATVRVKEESFKVESLEEPVASLGLELEMVGSINPRKVRVIESALKEWLSLVFPYAYCVLPAARPVPIGSDEDLAALRAGWRAEAAFRGFSGPETLAPMLPTPVAHR